jgi:hypothetical protein
MPQRYEKASEKPNFIWIFPSVSIFGEVKDTKKAQTYR